MWLAAAPSITVAQLPQLVPLGPDTEAVSELHVLGDRLIFIGKYKGKTSLIVADGTRAGTNILKSDLDIVFYEVPGAMTIIGTRAYFDVANPIYGSEPWTSDGTTEGTFRLGDATEQISNAGQYVYYKGNVYFTADDGIHGAELWVTNGTREGTHLAVDVVPGPQGSGPMGLVVYRDGLFFYATGIDEGGWWRSDGTPEGTMRTGDTRAGQAISPTLTSFRDRVYYVGEDPEPHLWTTDGTTAGTYPLTDAALSGFAPSFVVCNSALYFGAITSGPNASQLWTSDGTVSGTHEVAPSSPGLITCLGRDVYYWSGNVWRSDGTASGTTQLSFVEGFGPEPLNQPFFAYNGTIYFSAVQNSPNFPYLGYELWVLDHSAVGAHLVEDMNPGAADAGPAYFVPYRGAMYFVADDGLGRFLWRITASSAGRISPKGGS
jgi:ELWxxDGT repeat protein